MPHPSGAADFRAVFEGDFARVGLFVQRLESTPAKRSEAFSPGRQIRQAETAAPPEHQGLLQCGPVIVDRPRSFKRAVVDHLRTTEWTAATVRPPR